MKTHPADNYQSADITSRSTDLANKGVARLKFKRRQPPLPSLLPSSFFFPPFPSPSFHFSLTTWGLSERCEKSDDQPIIISFYCDRSSKASCDLLWHQTRTSYLLQHTLIISQTTSKQNQTIRLHFVYGIFCTEFHYKSKTITRHLWTTDIFIRSQQQVCSEVWCH